MLPAVALFLRTLVIGIAVAAPVGAMGVLCIQRTLAGGWRAGMATGLGIATADGIYAGFAAFGLAAVSQSMVALQGPLRLGGGIVLVWLGWRAIVTPLAHDAPEVVEATRRGSLYVSAVTLTLTNPMTIMAFGAIFASAGLVAQASVGAAVVATAGVAAGSLSWWIVLVSGTAIARQSAGDAFLMWVNWVSGAVIVGFGTVAIVAGIIALR